MGNTPANPAGNKPGTQDMAKWFCNGCKKNLPSIEFESSTGYIYRRCRSCRKSAKASYADPTFKGSGKLKCAMCGLPYRDHPRMVFCDGSLGAVGARGSASAASSGKEKL